VALVTIREAFPAEPLTSLELDSDSARRMAQSIRAIFAKPGMLTFIESEDVRPSVGTEQARKNSATDRTRGRTK
jgi:hypothetical protein